MFKRERILFYPQNAQLNLNFVKDVNIELKLWVEVCGPQGVTRPTLTAPYGVTGPPSLTPSTHFFQNGSFSVGQTFYVLVDLIDVHFRRFS